MTSCALARNAGGVCSYHDLARLVWRRRHVDPKLIRAFVRRLQLLQSFEPGYRLETDYIQDAAGMVGNAVPPALAAALVTPFAEQLR